jgi:type II secretion system protein D
VGRSLEQALAGMRMTGAVEAAQQIQVTPDASTNALVVVASPQDFEVVSQIIEKLDIVREQVLVEMLILEVSEESLQEIGVDWATLDEAVSDSVRGFGMTNLGPRVNFLSGTAEGLAVGAWKATNGGVQIGAILQALQKQSGVNILSTPSILTSNHRRARIIVGENRPFVTESRITESTDPITPTVIKSFEYRDVGITLEITPHVSQGGLIRLEIDSEFTKLIEDVTTLSLDTPATAKRTAQTVVTMGSGATVVIGGLIRDDTTHAVKKIPLVGDLPLVGGLFRSERDRTQKTNLLLFITPHVSQGGLIRMEIDSEFTKLIEDVTTLSLDTPATAKRTAQTVVTMGSGATVVIGGLIRDDTTHAVKKIPIMGDLPLVGPLFRSERDRTQKTNLLLFITPHVMSTQDDLLKMTDRKRDEMPPTHKGNN